MSIITLIITIITFIQQIVSGGKPPTPTPPVFPQYAQVSCSSPEWKGEPVFLDTSVQGQMGQDCTVHFVAIPLSGSTVVDRMTRTMEEQISTDGAQTDQVYDLSSAGAVVKTFDSNLTVEGAQVAGQTKLASDYLHTVSTSFSAASLPKSGDASFLKALQTRTDVQQGADGDTYTFHFSTYAKVQRPFLAPAGKFKSALIDGLKAKTDAAAKQALRDLIDNL